MARFFERRTGPLFLQPARSAWVGLDAGGETTRPLAPGGLLALSSTPDRQSHWRRGRHEAKCARRLSAPAGRSHSGTGQRPGSPPWQRLRAICRNDFATASF